VAAIWYERDEAEITATGNRCWITANARFVCGTEQTAEAFLSVFTDERKCQGGRVEFYPVPPKRPGIELYATEEIVLPPIDAVFVHGSDAVGEWLAANDWSRNEPYNDNFPDRRIISEYEREWSRGCPIFRQDDIQGRLESGAELVSLEIESEPNPWMKFAGMFKDDPLIGNWKTTMSDYRQEVERDPDYL
jgi:hypothetical protein